MYRLHSPFFAISRRTHLLATFAGVGLLLAAPAFAQQDTSPPPPLSDPQWMDLTKAIDERANELARSRVFFEDMNSTIVIRTRLNRLDHSVVFELDDSFGRYVGDLELEDFQDWIQFGIEDLTAQIPDFSTVHWLIGGKGMDHWFDVAR